MYFVYILRCSDNSFYVGSTQNLPDRVKAHDAGRGSTYTSRRRPVRLLYTETFDMEMQAIKRERQLKRWGRCEKAKPDRR